MRPIAPVGYPTSRHLDTPSHKNSLAVPEKTSSRKLGQDRQYASVVAANLRLR
jgi:hypothetical protein